MASGRPAFIATLYASDWLSCLIRIVLSAKGPSNNPTLIMLPVLLCHTGSPFSALDSYNTPVKNILYLFLAKSCCASWLYKSLLPLKVQVPYSTIPKSLYAKKSGSHSRCLQEERSSFHIQQLVCVLNLVPHTAFITIIANYVRCICPESHA